MLIDSPASTQPAILTAETTQVQCWPEITAAADASMEISLPADRLTSHCMVYPNLSVSELSSPLPDEKRDTLKPAVPLNLYLLAGVLEAAIVPAAFSYIILNLFVTATEAVEMALNAVIGLGRASSFFLILATLVYAVRGLMYQRMKGDWTFRGLFKVFCLYLLMFICTSLLIGMVLSALTPWNYSLNIFLFVAFHILLISSIEVAIALKVAKRNKAE